MTDYQLFNYQNCNATREYLKKEYDIGTNLPCIHIEEPKYGQETYKFLIGIYTYTHQGLYIIEGIAENNRVSQGKILSSGIVYIFDSGERINDVRKWLSNNVKWIYKLVYKK